MRALQMPEPTATVAGLARAIKIPIVSDVAEATQLLAPPSPSRRRRWPWIAVACVAVLAAAAIPTGIWFVHSRASLHSLAAYPVWGGSLTVRAGDSTYFGDNVTAERVFSDPHNHQPFGLQIDSIRPVVRENTAGADIVVLRCTLRDGGSGPMGGNSAAAHATCIKLVPFHTGRVDLGFRTGNDDIVVAVTPRHRGIVRVAGVNVRYNAGIRHATQHCGARIETITK